MYENVLCYVCKNNYIEKWDIDEWICDPCEIKMFGEIN